MLSTVVYIAVPHIKALEMFTHVALQIMCKLWHEKPWSEM